MRNRFERAPHRFPAVEDASDLDLIFERCRHAGRFSRSPRGGGGGKVGRWEAGGGIIYRAIIWFQVGVCRSGEEGIICRGGLFGGFTGDE